MTPGATALQLLAKHGVPEAWQRATTAAIDSHLAGDTARREHWRAVERQLEQISPRPGPSERDIYRSAKRLIDDHGEEEAARTSWQRACVAGTDLRSQIIWSRISDAVVALSAGGPEHGRLVF